MYQDDVVITEPGGGSYDAATRRWTRGDNVVLWGGKADVQEEARGVQYLRQMTGETSTVRLEVFFFEADWPEVVSVVQLESICETPIGTGPVVGIRHLDQMLIVNPTKPDA